MKNSFGNIFKITTFGESHGHGLGVVIDGCPSGVDFDEEFLSNYLARRRPGNFSGKSAKIVSQRKEEDLPEVLSGVFNNKTIGTPIAMFVRNKDARSHNYDEIKDQPRIGHADDVWKAKFGFVDHRGGGRSSGRETVARVMAGAVAEMALKCIRPELKIVGFSSQIAHFKYDGDTAGLTRDLADDHVARFPDRKKEKEIEDYLLKGKEEGKSYGGRADLIISGAPVGLGQPVFHKLKGDLATAMLGIGATSGVEIGDGLAASDQEGTAFHSGDESVYGGIRGGLATGHPIRVSVSFKPTSSVMDVAKKGRHDPCIVPRAVPVMEAMAAIVLLDHILWQRMDRA